MAQILTYNYEFKSNNLPWSIVKCHTINKIIDYLNPNNIILTNDKDYFDNRIFFHSLKFSFPKIKIAIISNNPIKIPNFFCTLSDDSESINQFVKKSIKNKYFPLDRRIFFKSLFSFEQKSVDFLSNIDSIIFDMDGTLLKSDEYSLDSIILAMKEIFSKYGIDKNITSKEDIRKEVGAPSDEFYKIILPDGEKSHWKELRDLCFKIEHELIKGGKGKLFDGVIETLSILKKKGLKLGMASNCSAEYFKLIVDTFSLDKYLDSYLCIGNRPGKNKTDLINEIKKDLNLSTSLFVGDRIYDLEAAMESNCISIGVSYGYGSKAEMVYAHYLINNFSQLINLIN